MNFIGEVFLIFKEYFTYFYIIGSGLGFCKAQVAESFFRTLKAEEVLQTFYATVEQLKASIDEYIRFFNRKRPHQKMKYLTPNQVEEAYFSAQE